MADTEKEAIKKFARNLEMVTDELRNYTGYLRLSPEKTDLANKALDILDRKVKALGEADSEKDLKKVLKLNKLYDRHGL
jgi:hypothetical protein